MEQLNYWGKIFLYLLSLVAGLELILSLIYWTYSLSLPIVISVLVGILLLGYWLRPKREISPQTAVEAKKSVSLRLLQLNYLIIFSLLLITLFLVRTDEAISSPWQVLPAGIFALYALASFLLIINLAAGSTRLGIFFILLHASVTWGVAHIVYALGFGYDPFIHQATERHILNQGLILPKQPFYIGQYVLVVFFAHLSRLPVELIDRHLVPYLAGLILPLALAISNRHIGKEKIYRAFPLITLFLLPLGIFTFTIPYNLAALFFVVIIFLLPLAESRRLNLTLILLALGALAAHPLLGLPAGVFVAIRLLFQKSKPRNICLMTAFSLPLILSSAFFIYLQTQGAIVSWPAWSDVQTTLFAMSGNPFDFRQASFGLMALYSFERFWPTVLALMGAMFMLRSKSFSQSYSALLWGGALGLILSALMLGIFIRIPDIILPEQFEFALRLLSATPLLFIPAIASLLTSLEDRLSAFSWSHFSLSASLALLMTATWYFTYPQHNAVAYFSAPGVGQSDFTVVETIDQLAHGRTYIALTPQAVSLAALTRLGFNGYFMTNHEKYYPYPIPTGGKLYEFYLGLFHDRPDKVLQAVKEFGQRELVYVVIPVSWDPGGRIHAEIAPSASQIRGVGEKTIYELSNP